MLQKRIFDYGCNKGDHLEEAPLKTDLLDNVDKFDHLYGGGIPLSCERSNHVFAESITFKTEVCQHKLLGTSYNFTQNSRSLGVHPSKKFLSPRNCQHKVLLVIISHKIVDPSGCIHPKNFPEIVRPAFTIFHKKVDPSCASIAYRRRAEQSSEAKWLRERKQHWSLSNWLLPSRCQ